MLNSQGYQEDGMREHTVEQYVCRKVPYFYLYFMEAIIWFTPKLTGLSKIAPHPFPELWSSPTPPLPTATMEHLQKALVLTTFYSF